MRLASRAKTDGRHLLPPKLAEGGRYGNRIEDFGPAPLVEVEPWLYAFGDRSRIYSVYENRVLQHVVVYEPRVGWRPPHYRL